MDTGYVLSRSVSRDGAQTGSEDGLELRRSKSEAGGAKVGNRRPRFTHHFYVGK